MPQFSSLFVVLKVLCCQQLEVHHKVAAARSSNWGLARKSSCSIKVPPVAAAWMVLENLANHKKSSSYMSPGENRKCWWCQHSITFYLIYSSRPANQNLPAACPRDHPSTVPLDGLVETLCTGHDRMQLPRKKREDKEDSRTTCSFTANCAFDARSHLLWDLSRCSTRSSISCTRWASSPTTATRLTISPRASSVPERITSGWPRYSIIWPSTLPWPCQQR